MVKCQQNLTECEKAELVIFKHQRKKLDSPIKIILSRKRLDPSKSVKYFGIKIDENLNWKQQIHDISIKLNRPKALLYTIRNFINRHILTTIYFAIFDTHLNYANLMWGQNLNVVSRIVILQKKPLKSMNFQSRDSHSSSLFKSSHILKLEDKILIHNVNHSTTFFHQSLKTGSPFALMFTIMKQSHLPLIKYLNHYIEQILSEKIRSLEEPLIVGIKLNVSSVISH